MSLRHSQESTALRLTQLPILAPSSPNYQHSCCVKPSELGMCLCGGRGSDLMLILSRCQLPCLLFPYPPRCPLCVPSVLSCSPWHSGLTLEMPVPSFLLGCYLSVSSQQNKPFGVSQIPIASVMGERTQNSKHSPGLAWEGFGFPRGQSPGTRVNPWVRDV